MWLTVLVVLVVVGVLLYLFNTFVTAIDPRIKTGINALVLLGVFLYLIGALTGRHFLGL